MTMLTASKQSVHYGFKPVHDLPTPPSATRPSPPVIYQDYKPLPAIPRSHSPTSQPMSAPPRGLPLPAAMIPPQHPPPTSGPPPPGPPSMSADIRQSHAPAPPSSSASHHSQPHRDAHRDHHREPPSQPLAQLPPPPAQWQHGGGDESYRTWLNAKAEEEKRKQEEEKTQQENIRLEQRRQDLQFLDRALSGGIPPPLVPLVFAAAAGGQQWSPAMADWAQQAIIAHTQQPHRPPQLMPAPGALSPERRRDSQGQVPGYAGTVPSTPGGSQGPSGGYQFGPASPRRGGGSVSGPHAVPRHPGQGPSNLPSLNTNVPQQGPSSGGGSMHPTPGGLQHQGEGQGNVPIFFHYWQPPTTEGDGGSNQPATPSVGEAPKKRKATTQQQAPAHPHQRLRSPPFGLQGAGLANPPRGPRRGHQRQQSDLSSYSSFRRSQQQETFASRGGSPAQYSSGSGPLREGISGGEGEQQQHGSSAQQPQQQPRSGGGHSVGSLLSSEPSRYPPYGPGVDSPRIPPESREGGQAQSEDAARRQQQRGGSRD